MAGASQQWRTWGIRLGLALLLFVGIFAGITLLALEGDEVVRLHTVAPDGTERATRVWIAEEDGAWWVEVADPHRPFLADLRAGSPLVVERAGVRLPCGVEFSPQPGGHARIRRLLRERYGWKDVWIGLIADTAESSALELRCPLVVSRGSPAAVAPRCAVG